MVSKEFYISKREAETGLSSILQHKLRVVLKCYTIINFVLNKEEPTFTFNKTNRINRIKITDSKNYTGRYVLTKEENSEEDKEYKISVFVG